MVLWRGFQVYIKLVDKNSAFNLLFSETQVDRARTGCVRPSGMAFDVLANMDAARAVEVVLEGVKL